VKERRREGEGGGQESIRKEKIELRTSESESEREKHNRLRLGKAWLLYEQTSEYEIATFNDLVVYFKKLNCPGTRERERERETRN
jgi:hypothetical protein